MTGSADISPCGTYRYTLHRTLANPAERGTCLFIMLNPSTADATHDDPTIRRCKAFADGWGAHRLTVVNLFAYRATDPSQLRCAPDPVGFLNNMHIKKELQGAKRVICAWGAHGGLHDRDREVMAMAQSICTNVYCLGLTKAGYPVHPLYQPKDATPIVYRGRP